MTETKPTLNQKLRYERERRGWSQLDVADKVGTTPLNVGRWERGVTTPGPHFRQKLCEVFEKSSYQLGLVQEMVDEGPPAITFSQETPASFWNVPYNRNVFFTGREQLLAQLRDALTAAEQPVAISQPQTISGLGGIGKTQTAVENEQKKYNQAEPLFQRALAIKEKAFGPEHPQVALDLNNLAMIYFVQGRYEEAESLLQRTLNIIEKMLGSEHPDTARSLKNIAKLYTAQGKFEEAEALYRRALAIREKIFSLAHPLVLLTLKDYAELLHKAGRESEARALEERVQAISKVGE